MKVAVSGITGFIGGPLVDTLLGAGHQVLGLTRRPEGWVARPELELQRFDALGGEPPELTGCDAVIHLAGEPVAKPWTKRHKERVLQSRKVGTSAMVEAALKAGTVKSFICASAVGYYGPQQEEVTEASPPGGDFLAQVCRAWEAATAPLPTAGIRTVRLRIGQVLHPSGGMLKAVTPLFKFGLGGRLGRGDQGVSWIHRDDLVRLILFVLSSEGLSGPVNGTAPHPVSNAEFTRELAQALHRPAPWVAPSFALKWVLGELSNLMLGGVRAIPSRALEAGFTFNHPHLKPALEALLC